MVAIPPSPAPRRQQPLQPSRAQKIRFDPGCHSKMIPLDAPASRPLHGMGLSCLGIDFLTGYYLAGPPRSLTHLVWILFEGQATLISDKIHQPMKPGQMAIAPANRPHWIESTSRRRKTTGMWFHLHDQSRWKFLSQVEPGLRPSLEAENLHHLMSRFLLEQERKDSVSVPLAGSYAATIALLLERELSALGPHHSPFSGWRTKLDALWETVEANLPNNWTVENLASQLQVSPGYFHRMCLHYHQVGPMQKVRALRVTSAMALLRHTEFTIDDIAERVGYSSAYALSKAFFVHTGLRPGSYRTAQDDVR